VEIMQFRNTESSFAVENLEARQLLSAAHHTHHASVHHTVAPVRTHRYHYVAPAVAPVAPAVVIPSNPLNVTTSGTVLNVAGTTANEQIVVKQSGSTFTIANGAWNTTVTGSFTQVIVKCVGGTDSVTIDSSVTIAATLYGGTGNDTLVGNNVGDTFYAGTGSNKMVGGTGNDTFVTVGNTGGDSVTGGAGNDSFWMGTAANEVVTDLSAAENAAGHLHRIGTWVNGRSLANPAVTDPTMAYKSFANAPLFGTNGPSEDDIQQGYLGDCYFLSALSAVAKVDADKIRQSVVALGDGTFAVQMHNAYGQLGFVRLTADLPTWGANGPVAYANAGSSEGLWVALMEKAFNYFRSGANPAAPTYGTIDNGGWMTESFTALGLADSDLYAGTATQLGTQLKSAVTAGKAVTLAIGNVPAGAPLIGDHAYTVDHVNLDARGNVASVTLRNPWGVDGAGNDGHDDGYVTVSITTLAAASMGVVTANA
jgi:hypothetical protein